MHDRPMALNGITTVFIFRDDDDEHERDACISSLKLLLTKGLLIVS